MLRREVKRLKEETVGLRRTNERLEEKKEERRRMELRMEDFSFTQETTRD